jgi:hypothetical protein
MKPHRTVIPGDHVQGTLTINGVPHMVDAVEIIPGEPGCMDTTVAYLSPLEGVPTPSE